MALSEPEATKPKFTMTLQDYEDILGRILIQKGVRGIAVTSRDGEVTYYNNRVPPHMLKAYTSACLNTDYVCSYIARQNDPTTRVYYIRVETDSYEMVVTVDDTHLIFMYCDPPEHYNGEMTVGGGDVDDDED